MLCYPYIYVYDRFSIPLFRRSSASISNSLVLLSWRKSVLLKYTNTWSFVLSIKKIANDKNMNNSLQSAEKNTNPLLSLYDDQSDIRHCISKNLCEQLGVENSYPRHKGCQPTQLYARARPCKEKPQLNISPKLLLWIFLFFFSHFYLSLISLIHA